MRIAPEQEGQRCCGSVEGSVETVAPSKDLCKTLEPIS